MLLRRHHRHARSSLLILAIALASSAGPAQDIRDPIFSTVPFDRWLSGGDRGQIPFKGNLGSILDIGLFQRLQLTVNISVDGREIAKRPASGQLLMFLQFTDSAGHVFQGHGSTELKDMTATIKEADLLYSPNVLVLPGDYQLAMAVFHTETGEHGLSRKSVHVPAVKDDPLPAAWQDLPPVEFPSATDAPDTWFQPSLTGRLHLPLETRNPVRIELLMILPGVGSSGGYRDRIMMTLVSAFRTLSQIGVGNGSLTATVLDLTRRRVSYEQALAPPRDLDWSRLGPALGGANANVIDVESLENRGKSVEFFVKEIGRRIESKEPAPPARRILMILSAPMEFASGTEMPSIHLGSPAVDVYYFRMHAPAGRRPAVMPPPSRGGGRNRGGFPGGERSRRDRFGGEAEDSLEATLRPLKPRRFDLRIPVEFRRALATMLEEIARR